MRKKTVAPTNSAPGIVFARELAASDGFHSLCVAWRGTDVWIQTT